MISFFRLTPKFLPLTSISFKPIGASILNSNRQYQVSVKSIQLIIIFFLAFSPLFSQEKTPADWGLTQIPFTYEGEQVNVVLFSNKSQYDTIKKPLFLFVQGSLPQPLLKYDKDGNTYSVFPFNPKIAFEDYHFVMIGKPGIPLMVQMEKLVQPYLTYNDPETKEVPRKYCLNNHLDYYVNRNKAVLEFLTQKDWVDTSKIVVAGHSEGVPVSFKMTIENAKMTHLVLLNAGLAGRVMSIITNMRSRERSEQDYQQTEDFFKFYEYLVNTEEALSDDCSKSDSHKATASFSYPYRQHLQAINIPVFFGYGTKDESVLMMDYLRVQTIRLKKSNFHFKSYFGLEHNFFGFKEDGRINYEDYNYDKVAGDFFEWLKDN